MLLLAIKEQIKSEIARERTLLKYTQEELEKLGDLPKKNLVCQVKSEHTIKYYLQETKDGKSIRKYLGGPEGPTVIALKKQRFYLMREKILERNIKLLRYTLEHFGDYTTEAIHNSLPMSYKDLPDVCFDDVVEHRISEWVKKKYKRNSYELPDNPTIACDGTPMRSKGEAIIYDDVVMAKVPYLYDVYIKRRGKSGTMHGFSPDFLFTCKDASELAWDHFGLLGEKRYTADNLNKMNKCLDCGFVIGDNYIITSDNVDGNTNELMILEALEKVKRRVLGVIEVKDSEGHKE